LRGSLGALAVILLDAIVGEPWDRISEATGFGAALLAGVGAGVWPTAAAAAAALPAPQAQVLPDPLQVEAYARAYAHYRAIYPALRGLAADPALR